MSPASIQLAVCTEWYLSAFPRTEMLRRLSLAGARCLQLEPWWLPNDGDPTEKQASAFAAALAAAGFSHRSLSWWTGDTPAQAYVDRLCKLLTLARPLNIEILNIYFGPFSLSADRASPNSDLEVWRSLSPKLLRQAEIHGVLLTLEPEASDRSGTARGCLEILKAAADHPSLAINYDPCNLYHGGDEAFPTAYETLKSRMRYCHLKNGLRATNDGPPKSLEQLVYTPILDGGVNIQGIVRRLCEDGYSGLLVLEPHIGTAEERLAQIAFEIEYIGAELRRWIDSPTLAGIGEPS